VTLKLLQCRDLYDLLERVDCDVVEAAQGRPCVRCGARLHRSDYARKPRWVGPQRCREWSLRYSLCCSGEGCRKRWTPPSVRFLGRRVYVGVAVLLVAAMCEGLTPGRVRRLRECLGVPRQTLDRWRVWWRLEFVRTSCWKELCGDLAGRVDHTRLPRSLLVAFGCGVAGLVKLMRALGPLTTISDRTPGGGAIRGR
jgi:hypothetical protein